MSIHLQQTIATLEQELDALDQRRGDLQRAIEIIRPLAGDDAAPRGKTRAVKTTKSSNDKRTDGRTDGRTEQEPRRRAARSLPDDAKIGPQENKRREKILAALADGPLATREIAKAINVDRKLVKMALQRMAKVGLLKGVGAGPGRRWTRPGTTPAKEAL